MKHTTTWLMSLYPLAGGLGLYGFLFAILFAETPVQNHHDVMAWGIHGIALIVVVYWMLRKYLGHLIAASQGYTDWKREHEQLKEELHLIKQYPPLAQWLATVHADRAAQNAED